MRLEEWSIERDFIGIEAKADPWLLQPMLQVFSLAMK